MLEGVEDSFVDVLNLPTRVIKFGRKPKYGDSLVLFVPGNPGLAEVYTKFLAVLHSILGMPVWIISFIDLKMRGLENALFIILPFHLPYANACFCCQTMHLMRSLHTKFGLLGHDDPLDETEAKRLPGWKGRDAKIYHIDGQVAHKVDFIKNQVPYGVNVHLVGHSIGALICLQTIRSTEIKNKIKHCYLLFPVLHNAARSIKGILFTKLVIPLYHVINFLYSIYKILPDCGRNFFLQIYFYLDSIPSDIHHVIKKYLATEAAINKAFQLAVAAMKFTQKLDVEAIEKHKNVLSFYYGASDGWVPTSCYHHLKEKFVDIDADLCSKGIWHGFSLRHSTEMAEILSDKIKKYAN